MKIELGSDWFESKSEEWVIPGLVCDSLTLISGEPKSGKTSLAMPMSLDMTGTPSNPHSIKDCGPPSYLAVTG